MEASKHNDRERRRTKPKTRVTWMSYLVSPKTVSFLVSVGKLATTLLWLYYLLTKVFRE